jgi:hypothetical protein
LFTKSFAADVTFHFSLSVGFKGLLIYITRIPGDLRSRPTMASFALIGTHLSPALSLMMLASCNARCMDSASIRSRAKL